MPAKSRITPFVRHTPKCPTKGRRADSPGIGVQTIHSGKLRGGDTAGTNCMENGRDRVPIFSSLARQSLHAALHGATVESFCCKPLQGILQCTRTARAVYDLSSASLTTPTDSLLPVLIREWLRQG